MVLLLQIYRYYKFIMRQDRGGRKASHLFWGPVKDVPMPVASYIDRGKE